MPEATSRQIGSTSDRSEKRTVGAADQRLAFARDPGALDDADHVAQVPGAVGVEERRAAVQPREVDVRLVEREPSS